MIEPIVTSLSIVSSSPAVIDAVTALLILSGCSDKIDALKEYLLVLPTCTIRTLSFGSLCLHSIHTHKHKYNVAYWTVIILHLSEDYQELLVVVCSLFHLFLIFHLPLNGKGIPTMIIPDHL